MAGLIWCAGLRDDLESAISIHSVAGKPAAIESENPVGFQVFSQHDKGGIGKVHGHIAVSFHQ